MSNPAEKHADKYERFLALHDGDTPLLLANAWDPGTAKLFAHLGYEAIATTSAGHAATLGRRDGHVTLEEVLAHAGALAAATDIPLNVDFENGFARRPAGRRGQRRRGRGNRCGRLLGRGLRPPRRRPDLRHRTPRLRASRPRPRPRTVRDRASC